MSSEAVIKSVSRKLKHYFEVKRLEDGFDLTGPYSPTMDHPPMKARPTLQYDGLHDKPVKKYFSPHKVRVNLTQMKCPEGKEERQDQIRTLVTRYMDDSNFVHPSMPEYSYYHTPRGRKLRVEYQGHGTGSLRKKKKPYNGGYPLLRSVAPHTISKGEAVRLVNVATKLLLATETYDMKSGKSSRSSSANGTLPHLRGKRPSTAKSAYTRPSHDIHGRKIGAVRQSKDDSDLLDSGFSSSNARGDGSMPDWLRKEIQKLDRQDGQPVENKFVHPHSGSHESKSVQLHSGSRESAPQRPRSALRRKPLADPLANQETQTREDASVQTDAKLSDEYDQMERVVESGPQAKYRVYVRTGNKLGASTTADVFITLYGAKGRSEEILLGESKNHKCKFVKGQEDEFHFTYFHVGEIKKIRIGHNRTELGSGWFLDTCTVNDLHDRVSYRCRCERWLSYRDEDGKTKRFFPVDTTRNIPPDSELTESESNYSVSSRQSSSSSYTSIEAGHSNKDLGATTYFSHGSDTASDTESDIARVDIRSESTPRTEEPSSPAKSSTVQSSSKPTNDFSSNKAQVSSRSDDKAGNDDSSSDIPVVMPIDEPTLSVEKSGKKDKKKESDDYMEGFKAGVHAARQSEDEKARHLAEEQNKLSQGACIHEASKTGDLRRVIVLVNHNHELIDAKDERGSSALHLAAAFGHLELVKWLAINCADLNAETPTGYTPVHVAALNGHQKCVMTLSAMGATIDPKSIDKQTPLHLASMSGRFDTCKWLVSNDADLDAEDNMERTPLELAEEYGHQDLANFFRAVKKDKQDPKSGYSLMRSSEKAPMSTISEEKKGGGSSAGTSSKKAELEMSRMR